MKNVLRIVIIKIKTDGYDILKIHNQDQTEKSQSGPTIQKKEFKIRIFFILTLLGDNFWKLMIKIHLKSELSLH